MQLISEKLLRFAMNIDSSSADHTAEKSSSPLALIILAWIKDIRFAGRMLAKNKGFAATALLTLALCIGANTAIFSMMYSLVIKPLPYRDPARIVEVYNSFPKAGLNKMPSNIVQYLDFKEHTDAFEQLALWQGNEFTLGEATGPTRIAGVSATAEIFSLLDLQPIVGRFFTAENQLPTTDKVAVLTESYWIAHFQEDPAVVGRKILIDGQSYEILGVAPHNFEAMNARAKIVCPISWPPDQVGNFPRYGVTPQLFGRLKPTANIAQGYNQVAALEQHFYDQAPPPVREFLDRTGHKIGVDTLQAQRIEPVKTAVYLLQGGVLFVLLIGCVNVANLLLARSNARRGELAIRVALGASRRTIARQLFIESALLTWIGSALGLGLAWVALQAANRSVGQLLPGALPFTIDSRVLGYTLFLTILTSLIIGLFPIIYVVGGSLLRLMQNQGRSVSTGRGVRTLSSILVVAQMAFALILLTGAGLLIRSFANATSVPSGFDPRDVITASVALPAEYRSRDASNQFQKRLVTELNQIPAVTASLATATPYSTGMPINAFSLRDYTLPPGAAQPGAFNLGASNSYLETLKIPLLEGRWFNALDTEKSHQVYVVDESFAKQFFPHGSAVGQHLTFGGVPAKPEDWPEIIGVVGNVRHNGVEEKSGNPYLYYPIIQAPIYGASIFLRTTRPTQEIVTELRKVVAAINPSLPIFNVGKMEDVISANFGERRATMLLIASFAGLALVLSAIGIYGVLAYDVSQRTREIGIRGAIGASREQIITLILRQGFWKTAAGLIIGIIGALALSRFMTTLLFEVKPTDPAAYIAVSLLLLVVALLASYLPARRAARIDPIIALRSE